MLTLAAITVWYNPQQLGAHKAVENILSYASRCERIYIVDNSADDNGALAAMIPNSTYIPLYENKGIATALNRGCAQAQADGFAWVMTMDQDSHFFPDQWERYLILAEAAIADDDAVQSLAPEQNNIDEPILPVTTWVKRRMIIPLLKKILGDAAFKEAVTPVPPEKRFVDYVIASANIIHLDTWEKIGKFDDALFIDEVDFDFCVRLRAAQFKIVLFSTCTVNHTLGQKKRTFFPKMQYESDFRLFYIFRNLLIENRRYGTLPFVRDYKKELHQFFCDYCIKDLHSIWHLLIFVRAYRAYRRFIKTDEICNRRTA